MNPQEQKIDINLSEEVAKGTYSNLTIITHSDNEFIMDFVNMMPGMPKGSVVSRIIMTPLNAKRLLNALADNVRKFEEKNGRIDERSQGVIPMVGGDGGLA
ncbi:MAG: DUF3467 domain-containing protein [Bacteroidales bacterium]|jgi:hypothetical protein|nr:DUF3467 domain-containing protein [Bacteroidales bacterium]